MKYFGNVGFAISEPSDRPGICTTRYEEHPYYGDEIKRSRRWGADNEINGTITMSTQISIVADDFAMMNCHQIRYVWYMNSKWSVTDINVLRPRIILNLGGVFTDGE